ncbi:MAG: 2Fe-2S iron-sulfur cluster-binding protein, partial [Pseudomonadota bacterium]
IVAASTAATLARPGCAAPIEAGASARITMDGATREITLAPGQTVLEAALGGGLDAPFSCTAGVCCTCRARLLEGEVEMAVNHALEDDEVRAGYVLTCQARPLTERLVIDYDQH